MSEFSNGKKLQWNPAFGPAALLALVQLVIIAAGGVYTFAALENNNRNAEKAVNALETLVSKNSDRATDLNNRLIRVEVTMDGVARDVRELGSKIDRSIGGVASPPP